MTDPDIPAHIHPLSITHLLAQWKFSASHNNDVDPNFYNKQFDRLAEGIINDFVLLINPSDLLKDLSLFQITELEFYLNHSTPNSILPSHPDPFAHCQPIQLYNAKWYFHQQSKNSLIGGYREGSRKGMDFTFGPKISSLPLPLDPGEQLPTSHRDLVQPSYYYGGILIRSMKNLLTNELIEGPSLLVDTVLKVFKVLKVLDLVEIITDNFSQDLTADIEFQSDSNDQGLPRLKRVGKVVLVHKHLLKSVVEFIAANETANVDLPKTNSHGYDGEVAIHHQKKRKISHRGSDPLAMSSSVVLYPFFSDIVSLIDRLLSSTEVIPIYKCPRVGLTLKSSHLTSSFSSQAKSRVSDSSHHTSTADERLHYLIQPYRYLIHPHSVKKGKPQVFLGVLNEYILQDKQFLKAMKLMETEEVLSHLAKISGCTRRKVEEWVGVASKTSYSFDEDSEGTISKYFGKRKSRYVNTSKDEDVVLENSRHLKMDVNQSKPGNILNRLYSAQALRKLPASKDLVSAELLIKLWSISSTTCRS